LSSRLIASGPGPDGLHADKSSAHSNISSRPINLEHSMLALFMALLMKEIIVQIQIIDLKY